MSQGSASPRILAVRLGAMGDIICTLPAVASLKHGIPGSHVTWAIEEKWAPLVEGNPYLDGIVAVDPRSLAGLRRAWREVRGGRFDIVVDFQGLIKSAVIAASARAERIFGFDDTWERVAAWFYSSRVKTRSRHMVERNLDLASAAGASSLLRQFPLPAGRPEGVLPEVPFVLASPLAGWGSKQWPIEHYAKLGAMIESAWGMKLVINAPREIRIEHTHAHVSGLPGLIDATRRAIAVVGVDSGPLHLAAALGKPGVAIYGPTDPARNGPYGGSIAVLRGESAQTTYKRLAHPTHEMRGITPEAVVQALAPQLEALKASARS